MADSTPSSARSDGSHGGFHPAGRNGSRLHVTLSGKTFLQSAHAQNEALVELLKAHFTRFGAVSDIFYCSGKSFCFVTSACRAAASRARARAPQPLACPRCAPHLTRHTPTPPPLHSPLPQWPPARPRSWC